MAWREQDAKAIADRILSFSKAEECEVALGLSASSYTRFAAGDVTTAGEATDLSITITSRGKGKSGTARINDPDPAELRRAVARSEEMMALAPVDPEFVEGLGPQLYPAIASFHKETERANASARRPAVKDALDAGRSRKMNASGFFDVESRWSAIANKKGLFGFHRSTEANYSTTMRTEDGTGSGWAGFGSPRISDIRAGDLVARAVRKAESSARPKELDPGRYPVILEPQALQDLLGNLGFSFSCRAADEGRSFFSKPGGGNRLGEKLFADNVTLRSDPFDPRIPGRPWAGGGGFGGGGGAGGGGTASGLPSRRTTWIEKGVARALSVDRYWAAKTEQAPLPYSGSLVMEGGAGTLDELIAATEKALLVTRFWYIRSVNPQTLQLTGLTRDGLWLVEKGKITAPVANFRFNESLGNLLKNTEALTGSVSTGTMVLPALRSRDFNFSSKSDAV